MNNIIPKGSNGLYEFPDGLYNNINAALFVRNLKYNQLSYFVYMLSRVLGETDADDRLAARAEFNLFLNGIINARSF